MSAKVCTCSSTQTDKHCMMMDRTFFLLLLLLFQVLLIERLCVMSRVWKIPVETCERQGKIHTQRFLRFKVFVPWFFFSLFFHFGVPRKFHAERASGKTSACQHVMLLNSCFCVFFPNVPMLCERRHFCRLFAKTQRPGSLKRTPLLIWQTTEPFSALPCSFLNKITHSLQFNVKKKWFRSDWLVLILQRKTYFHQNCLVFFFLCNYVKVILKNI